MSKKSELSAADRALQDIGFHIGMGIIRAVLQTLFWLIAFLFVFRLIGHVVLPTDDSDFSRFARSGVEVITDAKTGRQYLKTSQGFIVPREERR